MCWAPHAPTYTNACICRAYACPCTLLLPTCVTATHPYPFHFAQNTKLHFKLDSIFNTSSSSTRIPVVRNYCSLCERGTKQSCSWFTRVGTVWWKEDTEHGITIQYPFFLHTCTYTGMDTCILTIQASTCVNTTFSTIQWHLDKATLS